jgi:hypothetical protein
MEITVEPSRTYAVTTSGSCTVTDADGLELCTASSGSQAFFVATTPTVTVSDDGAKVSRATFNYALAVAGLLGEGDKLPAGYTRVEFLQSTGGQQINTGRQATDQTCIEVKYADTNISNWTPLVCTLSGYGQGYAVLATGTVGATNGPRFDYGSSYLSLPGMDIRRGRHIIRKEGPRNFIDGEEVRANDSMPATTWAELCLLHFQAMAAYTQCKLYSYKKWELGEPVQQNFVPALDPTGTPCMFDMVTRKPYYNSGTGDFTYPGKETQAATYSLRRPRQYAQMTERGIRRLYHVPRGYNGTPEEYAEENGFKILVETPAPEEGYWAPVWHDREDCIELEWVETEPTAEELSTIE